MPMVTQITDEFLNAYHSCTPEALDPAQAYDLACRLKNLAAYLLSPQVLEKGSHHRMRLFCAENAAFEGLPISAQDRFPPGTCLILVANCSQTKSSCLRAGFVFPVRWVESDAHHPHLPWGLREIADRVRKQVISDYRAQSRAQEAAEQLRRLERFHLFPEPPHLLDDVDLSQVSWGFESAWATLVAGLFLALWQAPSRAGILATGADGQGVVAPVEGLPEKLHAAYEFGAHVLFVPDSQLQEFQEIREACGFEAPEIRRFNSGWGSIRQLLKDYLDELEIPPGREADEAKRAAFYTRVIDTDRARQYYREYILPDVAKRLRKEIEQYHCQPTHVVLTISQSPELTELVLAGICPKEVLVFHDGRGENILRQIAATMKSLGLTMNFRQATLRNENIWSRYCEAYGAAIRDFLDGVEEDRIVVEVTAGKKIMSLACYEVTPPGAWVLCIETDFDPQTRRHKPFTERFHLFRRSIQLPHGLPATDPPSHGETQREV